MIEYWLSGRAARAVIMEEDRFFLLGVGQLGVPTKTNLDVLEHLREQVGEFDEQGMIDDIFPFPLVQEKLLRSWRQARAILLSFCAFDKTVPTDLRVAAGTLAETLLQDQEVYRSVQNRFMGISPDTLHMDLVFVGNERGELYNLAAELRDMRDVIRHVLEAWEKGGAQSNLAEDIKADAYRVLQQQGIFGECVRAIKTEDQLLVGSLLSAFEQDQSMGEMIKAWHKELLADRAGGVHSSLPSIQSKKMGPLERLFRELRIDWGDVEEGARESSELELCLEHAKRRFRGASNEFRVSVFSPELFYASIPYAPRPHFDGFRDEHRELGQLVSDLAQRQKRIGTPVNRGENSFTVAYDSAARSLRYLLLTTFFLTDQRRGMWGILPLATQGALGIVFRRENTEVSEVVDRILRNSSMSAGGDLSAERLRRGMEALLEGGSRKMQVEGIDLDPGDARGLVTEVMNCVMISRAWIFNIDGYVAHHIVESILQKERFVGAGKVRGFTTSVPREEDVGCFDKIDRYGKSVAEPSLEYRSAVHVFDVARAGEVFKALGEGASRYRVLIVRHGLNIPVGIGFSLPMFPHLFHIDPTSGLPVWKVLYDKAKNLYFGSEIKREAWSEVGINFVEGEGGQGVVRPFRIKKGKT